MPAEKPIRRWTDCVLDAAKIGEEAQRTLTAGEELLKVRWNAWTNACPGTQLESMIGLARMEGLISREEELKLWSDIMRAGLWDGYSEAPHAG